MYTCEYSQDEDRRLLEEFEVGQGVAEEVEAAWR